MSSSLINAIPVLDGSNFPLFEEKTETYLLSQGLASHLTEVAPTVPTLAADGTNKDEVDEATKELKEWSKNDEKARGAIRLRLAPSLVQAIKDKTTAKEIWDELKAIHSQLTLGTAYVEFKGLLETRIPDDMSPAAAISKIQAHIDRL